jgi:F420-non-reducing hydrogenase large subunit
MASGKAVDGVFGVELPPAGKKLRELFYCAHMLHSHIAHFYALGAPDFVLGPEAPPGVRNILGVIEKVGLEIGGEVIKNRFYAQKIQAILGGKATHPVCALPGGMSKALTAEERDEVEAMARALVEFGKFTLKLFDDVVLGNRKYVDLILSDAYAMKTYYMGLVDPEGKVSFYDGEIRVVTPEGKLFVQFPGDKYLEYIEEHVEPWSYLKFPYLKLIGWKGLVDGAESGIYRVAPLARLNVADGMATPLAQEAYEKFYDTLGGKPVHATLAQHWARVIEIVYAAELLLELATDPEITDPKVRTIPTVVAGDGIGVIEAPRGTLIHHYRTDGEAMVTAVNLIVATGHNNAAICMSIKDAAQGVIKGCTDEVPQGLLNRVEMAFRAYDPCLACATHNLPGQMPLVVTIRGPGGEVLHEIRRD